MLNQKRVLSLIGVATFGALLSCGAASPETTTEASIPDSNEMGDESNAEVAEDSVRTTSPVREERPAEKRDRRSGGMLRVKELHVSDAVSVPDKKALNPALSFRKQIPRVFASFYVSGLEAGGTITVHWYREDNQIQVDDIECEGEKRYAVVVSKPNGLANGDYTVEVELNGESFARRSFHVGGNNISPAVQRTALNGGKCGKRVPKRKELTFQSSITSICCSGNLLSIPDGAKVEVRWVSLAQTDETPMDTSEMEVKKGGKSSFFLAWEPAGELEAGKYKASILVNDRIIDELPFTVE